MKISGGKCRNFVDKRLKKGRSKMSAKIWPPVSEVLDPLVHGLTFGQPLLFVAALVNKLVPWA